MISISIASAVLLIAALILSVAVVANHAGWMRGMSDYHDIAVKHISIVHEMLIAQGMTPPPIPELPPGLRRRQKGERP